MPSGSFKLQLVISDEDDTPVYTKSDQKKADLFLKYFSSVFTLEPENEKKTSPHWNEEL